MESKDLNRLKVVLAENGGTARLPSVSWRVPAHQQVVSRTDRCWSSHSVQMVYEQCSAQLRELDGGCQMSRSKRQWTFEDV